MLRRSGSVRRDVNMGCADSIVGIAAILKNLELERSDHDDLVLLRALLDEQDVHRRSIGDGGAFDEGCHFCISLKGLESEDKSCSVLSGWIK